MWAMMPMFLILSIGTVRAIIETLQLDYQR